MTEVKTHESWCPHGDGYTDLECECGHNEPEARMARIEEKVDALDAKLTSVLASVDEIVSQAKPALEQVMNSPILAMLTGGKKNGR